jgi:ribosomal protein L32
MRRLIKRVRAIGVMVCPGCGFVRCTCAKVGTTTKK